MPPNFGRARLHIRPAPPAIPGATWPSRVHPCANCLIWCIPRPCPSHGVLRTFKGGLHESVLRYMTMVPAPSLSCFKTYPHPWPPWSSSASTATVPFPASAPSKRTIRAQSTRSWDLLPPAMATSPPPSCLCFELLGARAGDAVFFCGGGRRHVSRLLSLRASRPRRLHLASFIPFTPTHPSSAELSSLKD